MEENNVMNNQEEINDNIEEVTEAVEETTEEVVDEIVEVAEEVEDAYDDEDYYENAYQKDPRKPLIIVIAIMAVLILVLGGLLIWKSVPNGLSSSGNAKTLLEIYRRDHAAHEKLVEENEIASSANTEKYNGLGYANVSGQTVGDIYAQSGAEQQGIDFVMFLKMQGLPTDITKETYVDAVQPILPLYQMGVDLATVENEFGVSSITTDAGDKIDITLDMPFGLILENAKVSNVAKLMYGSEDLEAFKAEYELGEEVTEDTLWKEVRAKVEEVSMKKAKEEAEAKKEATEEPAEGEAVEGEEAPAPEAEAEATPAE